VHNEAHKKSARQGRAANAGEIDAAGNASVNAAITGGDGGPSR
jgi:hypothetical protein